jgi:hypothetical protein
MDQSKTIRRVALAAVASVGLSLTAVGAADASVRWNASAGSKWGVVHSVIEAGTKWAVAPSRTLVARKIGVTPTPIVRW